MKHNLLLASTIDLPTQLHNFTVLFLWKVLKVNILDILLSELGYDKLSYGKQKHDFNASYFVLNVITKLYWGIPHPDQISVCKVIAFLQLLEGKSIDNKHRVLTSTEMRAHGCIILLFYDAIVTVKSYSMGTNLSAVRPLLLSPFSHLHRQDSGAKNVTNIIWLTDFQRLWCLLNHKVKLHPYRPFRLHSQVL